MNKYKVQTVSFLLTVAVLALSVLWIGRGIYRLNDRQMDFDEAIHATRGLDFTSDIARKDWQGLVEDITKPEWYPPGHGLLLGAWFLITTPGIETARLYSTLFYLLFGILLWFSIKEILPDANPILYILPPLFLLSDARFSIYAGLSMLELPAITFAFSAILFLNRALRTNRLWDHLLAFTFGLLCLFTKYNYGLVIFAVSLTCYSIKIPKWRKAFKSRQAWIPTIIGWGLFVLIIGIWFIGLNEWHWLFEYANAQPIRSNFWSTANLLFYPRLLLRSPPNWLIVLLSLCIVIPIIRKRRFPNESIPYIIFFFISLIMLTLKLENSPRFGMMLFAPLWITATIGFYALLQEFKSRRIHRISYAALILILLFASLNTFRMLMSRLYAAYENANSGVNDAYQFVAEITNAGNSSNLNIVMLGRTDQWNGPAIRFHLQTICMRADTQCKITLYDNRELRFGWPPQNFPVKLQKRRIKEAMTKADYLVTFYKKPEQFPDWALVAEQDFLFKRINKKPTHIWVSIYQ